MKFEIKDQNKTKEQLMRELAQLRRRIQDLEASKAGQERCQEDLKQVELKYCDILDNAPVGIFQSLPAGRYLSVNREFARTLGYDSPEELMQVDNIADLYVEPLQREEMKRLLEERGSLKDHELFVKNRKTGTAWMSTNIRSVYDDSGQIKYYEGFTIDITRRKQIEEALRESEVKYRTFVQNFRGIAYRGHMDFTPIFFNGCVKEMTGYTEEDFMAGMPRWDEIIHTDDLSAIFDREGIKLRTVCNCSYEREYRIVRRDGGIRWVHEVIQNICDESNRPVMVQGTITDITDKKRLEEQLQEVRRMEAIGALAGGIAHDFNNLLMGIQGRISLMTNAIDASHPHFEHLEGIESYVKHATDLTRQLLGFARRGKYEVKPTDINDLVEKSLEMFGRTKKEITIHTACSEDIRTVEADQGQLHQVLLNLYVNAWQAMPGGGDLYVGTENVVLNVDEVEAFSVKPGPYVKISVRDTGIGMDEPTRQRIFEPFFTTRSMGKGTGLGLASVYGIITNHGGFIQVYSRENEGSIFSIYLPASEKRVEEEKKSPEDMVKGTEVILLVDDEDMIIKVERRMLEKLGYTPLTAGSGESAVDVYRQNQDRISLVVLDMIMPDMGGDKVYDRLKGINPRVKVLLSSGYGINRQIQELLDRGCNGFLQKPFDMKDLSKKLREILNMNN